MTHEATPNPWLHRFAVLTALATLTLIGVGGLVTSHGAGMAVPDWPTTYGYNMFLFPISKLVGGGIYEHTHRLVASGVGLLTAIFAGWIWARETNGWRRIVGLGAMALPLGLMGIRTQGMFVVLAGAACCVILFAFTRVLRDERPIRWWAAIAFSVVLVQGVLGGLRVTELKDELGIFHAALAQLFLLLICSLALVTSRHWPKVRCLLTDHSQTSGVRSLLLLSTILIFFQLVLGACMRHQHAGLAVPDFPLAYGRLWPAMDAESIAIYNQNRIETSAYNPITAFQIALHMAHRIGALCILMAVGTLVWRTMKSRLGPLKKWAWAWLVLIASQAMLGVATIWSNKAADVATLHVVTGAASLALGGMLSLWAFQKAAVSEESAFTSGESRVESTAAASEAARATSVA